VRGVKALLDLLAAPLLVALIPASIAQALGHLARHVNLSRRMFGALIALIVSVGRVTILASRLAPAEIVVVVLVALTEACVTNAGLDAVRCVGEGRRVHRTFHARVGSMLGVKTSTGHVASAVVAVVPAAFAEA
jgi:hypothetical protein